MYLYETHCHCSQCSHCASSTSQELALAYYKAGYAGMILTDHFISGNTALDRSLPWDIQVKAYYQAYLDALEAVADLDFDVLFGIEHAYGDGKEVLVYGIDLDFLLANPDIAETVEAQVRENLMQNVAGREPARAAERPIAVSADDFDDED